MGILQDLFSGDFTAVENDIAKSLLTLPTWAQSLIATLESEEGKILSGLVTTAASDVLAGGLTTASFTAAAKDVEGKLVSQEISVGTQTVYSALNAAVAAVAPKATPASTDPVVATE